MEDFYVLEIKNSLSKPICNEIIERFEAQENKYEGITFGGVNKDTKDTLDFHLSMDNDNWRDIDKVLFNELNKGIKQYIDHLDSEIKVFGFTNLTDKGFQIQKYKQGEGKYVFHNDFICYGDGTNRIFTYLWYLNTIDEGGETDFYNKGLMKAEQGKLILFPSCWTYPHSARVPISDNKYIITGWCCVKSCISNK
jgi:hypothetical protein